jgi:hypothetical protein
MSRPFKIYRLQQIDSQIDWLQSRLKDVTAALEDDSELRQADEKLARANMDLLKAQQALHASEYETQQQRIKIEQTDATLYGGKIRNPKELQDLQNESAALRRYLNVLEDRQLETMLSEEELSAHNEEIKAEHARISQDHQSRLENLSREKEKLLSDITRSEEERLAALTSIDAEDLSVYTKIRQRRRGIAVAKVVDRACSACGSTLSAALLNAAHSPGQLNYCERCGRILYAG